MTSLKQIAGRLALRRGLDEHEAAVYLSMSPSYFLRLVEQRRMPRPRLADGRRIWDIDELDRAIKRLPREGGEPEPFQAEETDTWADFK
jgi:excisionase family DNA binding protein